MEWREQEGVTKSQLKNLEISHDHFVEIWDKFFKDVFTKINEEWDQINGQVFTWDCIVCEVWDHDWQIALLPYDSKSHWADRERVLVVSLPEHVKSMIALEQDEHIMKNHEDNFFTIVSLLTDHLIRMMIAAFQDYSNTVKFWTQDYHDVTMVRFFRYTDDKFATLRAEGVVYEDMTGL